MNGFPKGIEKVFKNLNSINSMDMALDRITQIDLRPLDIDPNVFDGLDKLTYLLLKDNNCKRQVNNGMGRNQSIANVEIIRAGGCLNGSQILSQHSTNFTFVSSTDLSSMSNELIYIESELRKMELMHYELERYYEYLLRSVNDQVLIELMEKLNVTIISNQLRIQEIHDFRINILPKLISTIGF